MGCSCKGAKVICIFWLVRVIRRWWKCICVSPVPGHVTDRMRLFVVVELGKFEVGKVDWISLPAAT